MRPLDPDLYPKRDVVQRRLATSAAIDPAWRHAIVQAAITIAQEDGHAPAADRFRRSLAIRLRPRRACS